MSDDQTLTSAFLVAMPQLEDPNFQRSVMLIVEHDENGTFGLVLNRTVDLLASTLCASLEVKWRGDPKANIRWGGPVEQDTGWLLFDAPSSLDLDDPAITRVGDGGLYLARSLEVLRQVSSDPPGGIRFYLGYAGWGPGQLESEMAQGAWLVAPMSHSAVFEAPIESIWDNAVRSLGINPASLVSTQGVH
ncbi:MAG: putative transcriptional regulator [Myxococcota bacterium]